MAGPRSFLGASSAIQMLLLLLQILFIPSCLSLKLNTPSSNSEYVELVSGKSVQVTWTVESGDPSSFKLKLRNRNIDGRWTLSEDVQTSNGHVIVTLPVVPSNINYYIEADVYDPDMRILSNTYPSPFSIITEDSAHLKNTPSSSSSQVQNTPTPAPTPSPTSTPNSTPSSTVKPADETTASSTAKSITSIYSSTITRYSGTSIIGIIVETATTVLPQTFSSSSVSASSQPSSVAPSNDVSSQKSSDKSNLGAILGGVLGGVCLFALVLIVFLLHRRRKSRRPASTKMSIEDGNESVAPFSVSEYQPTEVQYGKGPLTPVTAGQGSQIPETSLRQQMDAMSQRIRQLEAQVDPRDSSEAQELPPQYSEATVTPRQAGRLTKS